MKRLIQFAVAFIVVVGFGVACQPLPLPVTVTVEITSTIQPTALVSPSATVATTLLPSSTPLVATSTPSQRRCSRLSYNINGQGLQDEQYLMTHLQRLRPCVVLVMDNFGLAVRIAETLPTAEVVVRTYSRFEGGQCLQDDPKEQVRRFHAEWNSQSASVKARLLVYGCSNEPSYGENNTLQQILDGEHIFLEEARRLGIRACSGNWGVGGPQPEAIESGIFLPYLRDLARGNHVLCVHEYTTFFLPFGTGQFSRECLITGYQLVPPRNSCVQPANWPTSDVIRPARIQVPAFAQAKDDWSDIPFGYERMFNYYSLPRAEATRGVLPPYWHLFRVYWLYILADENGIPRPRTIITEGLHDNLADIDRAEPRAISILRPIFGIEQFTFDLRGAPSHCKLWEQYYFPQWSCHEALLQQWLWWDSVATSDILGVTAYTWSWNDMWKSFDMSTRRTAPLDTRAFHRRLEECIQSVTCVFRRS